MSDDLIVYSGLLELYSWTISSSNGVRVRFRLAEREELAHFEGERPMRRSRAGKPNAGSFYSLSLTDVGDQLKTATIACWYKGPSWSQSVGALIQFELAEESDLGLLRHSATADAGGNGAEFGTAIVQLDEDGAPVSQRKLRAVQTAVAGITPLKGGAKSKHVARKCLDAQFVDWLVSCGRVADGSDRQTVAGYIRNLCGVTSRAELDTNDVAWEAWHALEREYIRSWEPA